MARFAVAVSVVLLVPAHSNIACETWGHDAGLFGFRKQNKFSACCGNLPCYATTLFVPHSGKVQISWRGRL